MDLKDKGKIPSLFLCSLAEKGLNIFRTKARKKERRKPRLDHLHRGRSCSSKTEFLKTQIDKNQAFK